MSRLSLENNILLYKVILKTIWTYGIQLGGDMLVYQMIIEIIQSYISQSYTVVRKTTSASWFVVNQVLYKDLKIPTVN